MDLGAHRRRAEELRGRYPFAGQLYALYLALLDAWSTAAGEPAPDPAGLAGWAAEQVLPGVVKATEAAGPEPLVAATRELTGPPEDLLAGWLAGADLPPVERYLARATLRVPLELLGADAGVACAADPAPRGGRNCPRCGGLPQLSVRSAADDRLVSGRRDLLCARCGLSWSYSGSACPSCGETTGSKRTVYGEPRDGPVVARDDAAPTFPHLRVDACVSCHRYLIDVDLGRDATAVPEVDELAALPLDLYASEHGLSKITPNLMGL